MNREHVLEWADDDRKDRGLIRPVGIKEEELVCFVPQLALAPTRLAGSVTALQLLFS